MMTRREIIPLWAWPSAVRKHYYPVATHHTAAIDREFCFGRWSAVGLRRSRLRPAIDPRRGDIEDDASSTKRRSMLSLFGSLLAEISLPKLLIAFTLLMVLPGLMLGVAPILAAIWLGKLSSNLATALAGFWPAVLLAVVIIVGWFGGRRLFRLAENSFW